LQSCQHRNYVNRGKKRTRKGANITREIGGQKKKGRHNPAPNRTFFQPRRSEKTRRSGRQAIRSLDYVAHEKGNKEKTRQHPNKLTQRPSNTGEKVPPWYESIVARLVGGKKKRTREKKTTGYGKHRAGQIGRGTRGGATFLLRGD